MAAAAKAVEAKVVKVDEAKIPPVISILDMDHYIGQVVTINGWADSIRRHGKLTFVQLRDGLCGSSRRLQVVMTTKQVKNTLHREAALSVTGLIREDAKAMRDAPFRRTCTYSIGDVAIAQAEAKEAQARKETQAAIDAETPPKPIFVMEPQHVEVKVREGKDGKEVKQAKQAKQAKGKEARKQHWSKEGKEARDKQREPGFEMEPIHVHIYCSSSGEIENLLGEAPSLHTQYDYRHLQHAEPEYAQMLFLRDQVEQCFEAFFRRRRFTKVTPPMFVQNQVEGGSTLFHVQKGFFKDQTYLTQSSQLYLEYMLRSLGRVFCLMPSFRAEDSNTRRHLPEFSHLEWETSFQTFEGHLQFIEELICGVSKMMFTRFPMELMRMNPKFSVPSRPFVRMTYHQGIDWLNEHKILLTEEGQEPRPYKYGDDISEAPERKMVDTIGKPVMLIKFMTKMKAFYTNPTEEDPEVTESCDLLFPGVGEVIGSGMRRWKLDSLLDGFKHEKLDPAQYGPYVDQRKYGAQPHGGAGLGMERFLCWMFDVDRVQKISLFHRSSTRCVP